MPAVRLHLGRSAVVTGDDQHIRLEGVDSRNGRIEFFGAFDLGVKIAVFACTVGVLKVNEEVVVF